MKIFYSWQSDLPNRTNHSLIEGSLKKAAQSLGIGDDGVESVVDRDTQGVPGAPHIAVTIFEKIMRSDAFVCDASIVGKIPPKIPGKAPRPTPNPNVLAELGFAVAALGWERVLMVFNQASGDIRDLPFDLDRSRVLKYTDVDEDHDRGAIRKELTKTIQRGLELIRDEDLAGRLLPTLGALRAARLEDQTQRRTVTPPKNLKRLCTALSYGNTDAELAESIPDAISLAERLRSVPLRAAQFLVLLLERAKVQGKSLEWLHYDDALLAIGTSTDEFDRLVKVLEHHNMILLDTDEEGALRIGWCGNPRSGWELLKDLRIFSSKTGVPLGDLLIQLRFELLDE